MEKESRLVVAEGPGEGEFGWCKGLASFGGDGHALDLESSNGCPRL